MQVNKLSLIVAAILAVQLGGCSIYEHTKQVKADVAADKDRIAELTASNKQLRFTSFKDEIYVGQLAPQEVNKPSWWFKNVDYRFRELPFDVMLQQLFSGTPVSFKFLDNLNATRAVTVAVSGNLGQTLDAVSNSSGYSYQVKGNVVVWSKYQTKVFDVGTYPGLETFGIGKTGDSQTMSSTASVDSTTTASVVSSSDEYTHTEAKLDHFSDLKDAISLMLSPEGKVSINESSTSVVVRDYPNNVSKVEQYLSDLNAMSNRQVLLRMEVISVQYTDESRFGLDWNLVNNSLHNMGVSLTSDTASGLASGSFNMTEMTLKATGGALNGSSALIQAISEQAKVSEKTETSVMARNNHAAKLRDVKQQYYITKSTIDTTDSSSSSGIEQGIVETGFSLYAVPKIMNDNVILRLTTNLSSLLSLERKSQTLETSSGTQETYVESPEVSNKDFDQSLVIPSGQTMILSGLNRSSLNGTEAYSLSAGVRSASDRGETIIAITPIIINQ